MRAGLERVTDEGLRALASAGCGKNLTSLSLFGFACHLILFVGRDCRICGCDGHSLSSPLLLCKHAGLKKGVTNSGLRALASAGCGKNLTSLYLGRKHVFSCCPFLVCGGSIRCAALVFLFSPSLQTSSSASGRDRRRAACACLCWLWKKFVVADPFV